MANRTIQIFGQGYGTTPCTINAVFAGNTVFSGPIPTVEDTPSQSDVVPTQVLFSFDVPMSLQGNFPVSISFSGEKLLIREVKANYAIKTNSIYDANETAILKPLLIPPPPAPPHTDMVAVFTSKANPPFSQEEIDFLTSADLQYQGQMFRETLLAHGCEFKQTSGPLEFLFVSPAQSKTNVSVNGEPQLVSTMPQSLDGEWGYYVYNIDGQGVITFDLTVSPGLE